MARKGDPSKRTEKHIKQMKWHQEQKRVKKFRALRTQMYKIQAVIRRLEAEGPPVDPTQTTLNAWVQEKAPTELLTLNDAPVPESNGQQTNPLIEWTVSEYKQPDLEVATPSSEGGPYNDYLTLALINNF
jgi:hypothetical protein